MTNRIDKEFHLPPEEHLPAPELTCAPELTAAAREDRVPSPVATSSREYDQASGKAGKADEAEVKEDRHKKLKMTLLKPVIAVVATVSIASAAGGYSILTGEPLDDFSKDDYWWHQKSHYSEYMEMADDAFPTLTNLEPNGEVPGYGVINEEYILLRSENKEDTKTIVSGSAYASTDENGEVYNPTDKVPGVSYDSASNTLTLENYSGPLLEVNMMGNGFKICLIGENTLEGVLVWGFHYGGSVTFIGSGKLTVTKKGILLRAEGSESCVMIDRGVKLDITGEDSPILVEGISSSRGLKGLYYLSPLSMTKGCRRDFDIESVEVEGSTVHYSNHYLRKINGESITHIIFQ
ncbi:MAG: hypothetical protein KIG36_05790 [Eubacteriales bacterium]|nr:hypothetical protein [Eubacteriales bacterium]